MKEISIRLGIKDDVIRAWWEEMSSQKINISQTINYAVEYYVTTGNFFNIAAIEKVPQYTKSITKKCYLPESSVTYQWLESRKKAGVDISATIKRILRNSIKVTSPTFLKDVDELMQAVETLNIVPPKIIRTETERQSMSTNEGNKEVSSISGNVYKNEQEYDQPTDFLQKPRFMSEANEETDLFDVLLGDNKLSL